MPPSQSIQGSAPFSPVATGLILVTESSVQLLAAHVQASSAETLPITKCANATSAVDELHSTLMYSEMKIW
jgi:hypothetical protein